MEENPYESPKEVGSPPTVKAGMALGVLLLLSIPAGCICGGITCYAVGITGEMPPGMFGANEGGWLLGIPLGLIVVVLVPVLVVRFFGRRKDGGIMRQ